MAISPLIAAPRLVLKYWWQLVLAVGLPVVAAVALEAWYGYQAELEQIKRTQSVQALSLAASIEANLQSEVAYLSRLYRTPWPGRRLERLAEEAEIALSLFPSVLQVSVEARGREKVFVSQLEPRRVAAEDAVDAGAAVAARDLAPRYSVARLGEREIPVVIARISNDRIAGEQLVAAIDLRAVSDVLAYAGRRDGAAAYVVGSDGKVLAHSDPAAALAGQDVARLPHVAATRQGAESARVGLTLESADPSGRPVLATTRLIGATGWLIVLERPLADVTAPIRAEAWRTLWLIAVALVAAAILGAGLARRFARPILQLGVDVQRIGRGELGHRTAIRTGDEIERLGGQVNEMAGRLEDYTTGLERKVAERTAELEAAMRARALFLAAASHDLRQPLYAISILADTLSIEPLDATAAEVLAKQREAIAVLRALFDNLLDLSRFDAGEVRPVLRVVALRELLAPAVLEAEVVCHSKGLAFHSEIDDAWVETDPDLLRRVAGNLLSNAVRYTIAGGVALTAKSEDGRVLLTVSDSGIGIAEGERERIFEEFVQLANPARDRQKGVGLGLSIVKRICDLLGTPISMRSAPGRGTAFWVPIPLASGAPDRARVAPAALALPNSFKGAHVWIVEDDPLVRDALSLQLATWGAACAAASTMAQVRALRESQGRWPDFAIVDDMLGAGEDGLEIASWLGRQVGRDGVVLVTGNADARRFRELEDSGFDVLRKPLSSGDLAQRLSRAMRAPPFVTPAPDREPAG